MLLVLGASGNIGRATVAALKERQAAFVAAYRRPEEAEVAQQQGVNTVLVDYADPESLRTAFAGKERIFFVSPPSLQQEEMEGNIVEAAKAVSISHLVKSSVWGAEHDDFFFAHAHRASEKRIEASGLAWTLIRPNSFFQNLMTSAYPIKAQGILPVPGTDAAISEIDVRDIGQVVATVLTGEGHAGKAYRLGGPEAITGAQKAALLSELLGRTIQRIEVPELDWRSMVVGAGVPEWQADALLDLQRYYIAGRAAEVVSTVQDVTGQPPITFRQFLEENLAAFRS